MAPAANASLLFHPKKKPLGKDPERKPPIASRSKPTLKREEEDEQALQLPDVPFTEFRLMSSALNDWKYDVMKFESREPVDLMTWQRPIGLNRKEPKREEEQGSSTPQAVGPMRGLDGELVTGADGRVVMMDAEGRPIHNTNGMGDSKDIKGKGGLNGKKRFQKKTKQVFLVPEATRQLRREERYPWVMESASKDQIWVGRLDEASKAETHAFFMPAANDIFKFVPAHRWYKFQKKLPFLRQLTSEEVDANMAKDQRKRDPSHWLLHNKGAALSAETAAMFEGKPVVGSSSLVHSTAGPSLGPGGRRLKTVDDGMGGLFGDGNDAMDTDDDEEDAVKKEEDPAAWAKRKKEKERARRLKRKREAERQRRRERELGGEGEIDEMEYEEDFADDDEKQEEPNDDDEEKKEQEERQKREYKNANKMRDSRVDDEIEDEVDPNSQRGVKAMKKLLGNHEKNENYASDEEKNPYASSEEEEEEAAIVPDGPAIVPQPQQVLPRSGSQTPQVATPRPASASHAGSRATSPTPPTGLGGHSVVAKRATSPKPPKLKNSGSTRAASPLAAGHASRATSPAAGSRATSPSTMSRAGSPVNGVPNHSNKRKASDDHASGSQTSGTAKKRKAQDGPLNDRVVIEWIQNSPNPTTVEASKAFRPYCTDQEKVAEFTALIKRIAKLKNGRLVLRNLSSQAPSPAP